jgi:hypothetical protein
MVTPYLALAGRSAFYRPTFEDAVSEALVAKIKADGRTSTLATICYICYGPQR